MNNIQVKLTQLSKVEEMAQMLMMQDRKLRDLEARLHKETQAKANLEIDFQHLLDHLSSMAAPAPVAKKHALVCS